MNQVNLREQLAGIGDIERILARIALLSARPRDLSTLGSTLQLLPALQQQLAQLDSPLLQELSTAIGTHPEVVALLDAAVIDEPPMLIRDGGVIKTGFDPELDELRALSSNESHKGCTKRCHVQEFMKCNGSKMRVSMKLSIYAWQTSKKRWVAIISREGHDSNFITEHKQLTK